MIDLSKLNKHQSKAVSATEGPILVVAGAGTGKTRVLTMRVAYLIDELGYDPEKILAITFTNKAANEMRYRIGTLLPRINVPWIGTYHAICLKILRKNIDVIGFGSNFTVIDDEDQTLLIRDIYKMGNIAQKDIKPSKMIGIIEKIKMNDVVLNEISTMHQLKELGMFSFDDLKIVKYVYQQYQSKLKQTNVLDFNDLLLFTHKILKDNAEIRGYWQKKFHYILVDEFQDTNLIQFEILNFLINPSQINVFAVGDPDQTIYTWRGAYANIFNDYLETYKNTQVLILDLNYRSTKNILKIANRLISHNHERIKKDLSTDNPEGFQNNFYKSDSQYLEANFISQQIIELVKKNKYSYSDIAILYRSNYLSRFIEQELMNNSIPYYIYGGIKFFQRMEIKDLLAYLRLMVDDQNEIALKRVINVPRRNIGDVTLDRISEYAKRNNITFAQALTYSQKSDVEITWSANAVIQFLQILQQLKESTKNLSPSNTLKEIIKQIKYQEYLSSLDFESRLENVNELIAAIEDYESKKPEGTIEDYLQEITLYTDPVETQKVRDQSVSLMTVHVAKGSEYKVIFIAAFNEGIFPVSINGQTANLEEERRIAYVALTRAMERLYITCSLGHSFVTNASLTPSRFLREMDIKNLKLAEQSMKPISNADLSWYDSKSPLINFEENYSKDGIEFKIGDTIAHVVFGTGVVVGIKENLLDIAFKAPYGVKTLVKNHKAIKRMKS